jgi:cyanobactin biosynthesis protein (PatB/AcyB/McaB family)
MKPPYIPPVLRPEITQPFLAVELAGGDPEKTLMMIFDLVHGYNFNDPQRFINRDYHRLKASMQTSVFSNRGRRT